MNRWLYFIISYCLLFFLVISVSSWALGKSDAQEALITDSITRFPEISPGQFITNEEISILFILEDFEQYDDYIQEWEHLVVSQGKIFASSIHNYVYDKNPFFVTMRLYILALKKPNYINQISFILGKMCQNASYFDIYGGMPSTIVIDMLLQVEGLEINPDALEFLSECIPNEKDYVLALYKIAVNFNYDIDSEDLYRIYKDINQENYSELLQRSLLDGSDLLRYEGENFGLEKYFRIKSLIRERLSP